MMLTIVRYVRHLDTTVHALHIKTKLCQLVEATMARRDDLAFRQEMKFRNKLVRVPDRLGDGQQPPDGASWLRGRDGHHS
ncbi:hypothetical protein MRX96_027661 [Rhipicephalus microplus]